MKKKILVFMLCLAATIAGCGQGTGDTESGATETGSESSDLGYSGVRSAQMAVDFEKQIKTLSEYKGIDVTITGDYEVTDEKIEESALGVLSYSGAGNIEVTDRDTVQDGDYVMIDYTGYKDDVPFDGGAATDVMMDASNNMDVTNNTPYIDGFCDDLVGAKVGDTLHTHVTFPENYQSEELAGQPAVFEITVKGIYKSVTMDELTDEIVAEAFKDQGIETKEQLLKNVKEALESQMASYKSQATVNAVKNYIIEHSEVEIPEDYIQARLAEIEYSTQKDNCAEGQTLAEFFETQGTTLEAQRENWLTSLEEQIKLEFLFGRIAQLEKLEVDDEEFSSYIDYLVQSNSSHFSSPEEVYTYYGVGYADEGEAALRQLFLEQQAISFVAENANVMVEPESTEE